MGYVPLNLLQMIFMDYFYIHQSFILNIQDLFYDIQVCLFVVKVTAQFKH